MGRARRQSASPLPGSPRLIKEAALTTRLTIDRFEGDKKQIAVLLAEDGTTIDYPELLLPIEGYP
jgi:hypothetical protein